MIALGLLGSLILAGCNTAPRGSAENLPQRFSGSWEGTVTVVARQDGVGNVERFLALAETGWNPVTEKTLSELYEDGSPVIAFFDENGSSDRLIPLPEGNAIGLKDGDEVEVFGHLFIGGFKDTQGALYRRVYQETFFKEPVIVATAIERDGQTLPIEFGPAPTMLVEHSP
ncbi:MAG: hypothetical protein ACFB20_09325 [Opitutales bacterium]